MRGHDFDCYQAIQFRLIALQYNSVSALTDELPNLNVAECSYGIGRVAWLKVIDDEVTELDPIGLNAIFVII